VQRRTNVITEGQTSARGLAFAVTPAWRDA
jgi:hypothetical protein